MDSLRQDLNEIENVYALNESLKEIYIGDVPKEETGLKKPYFCLGCKRRMQAIIPASRRRYFRHHVDKNNPEPKCTYSDETYRHWFAKTSAASIGKIKVPAVYKHSPLGTGGHSLLLSEARYIEAHTVKIEWFVYENENGEIKASPDLKQDRDKYLHIRPDTLFLDHTGKPILIIEFVATHKPDQQKLMKLKRLGIDAIQVSVPKSSPEDIQSIFHSTSRTKWIYNNEEAKTDYIQFSKSYTGGVYDLDIEQRKLLDEGFACRKAHLGAFIRRVGQLLEDELYISIEREIRSELQRIEEATRINQHRLESIQEECIRDGVGIHSERREKVNGRHSDLEGRYRTKDQEISNDERKVSESITTLNTNLQRNDTSAKGIEKATESIRRETDYLDGEIEEIVRLERTERENFDGTAVEIQSRISSLSNSTES